MRFVVLICLCCPAMAQVLVSGKATVSGGAELGFFSGSALPDTALLNWDTSQAGTPAAGPNICVSKSLYSNPGGITCGTIYDTGSPLSDLQNALNNAACDQVIVLANIQYLGNLNRPNGPICSVGHYWVITRDITDTTFPAEGNQVDPCSMGIPQTAMPYYRYPSWDVTPNTCARHMPKLSCNLTSGNSCFGYSPGASTQAGTFLRVVGIEFTRNQATDLQLTIIDEDYQPSTDCATTGVGNAALPVNAVACMNDQPGHVIYDRCIIHGDAQRQTAIGLKMAGIKWIALIDSYCYDVGTTYAGGGGDGHCYGWGTGHGYTNVGEGKFVNDFIASSTMASEFCGAFVEPQSPATGFDGIPTSILFSQQLFWKNPRWDPQIGTTLNETEVIEGQSYGPSPAQELDVTPGTIQLQVNQAFQFQTTWLNDTAGGINRMTDAAGGGSVTVDGITNGNATVGTMSKVAEHTVGSGAWNSQNQITWTYTAPASAGTHTIIFNTVTNDERLATLGNNRTLSATSTVTVVSGTPASQIAVSPSSPTLALQPSYSDAFSNIRQFCLTMFEFANYSPGAITWKVDGITGGNASVGTVTSSATGLASGEAAYCSGTGLGAHTIAATDGTTTGSSVVTVSTSAAIMDYDLKPYTSKNVWELKCGRRILLQNFLGEVAWGSNGNGGGQDGTALLLQSLNQAGQVNDGSGVNVGYGPETIVDTTVQYGQFSHVGFGMALASLNQALGQHRTTVSNVVFDDATYQRWGNGFLKIGQTVQYSGTASTSVLPWTSLASPLIDNIVLKHLTFVAGTGGVTSLASIVNNNAQFPLGPLTIQDSILASDGATTFAENNGDANDCNTASGNGVNNTEAKALQGSGYVPAKPCAIPYTFNFLALTNSTASPANFASSPIWQPAASSADLFANFNSGYGGDYRVCTGSGIPVAGCTAGTYAAGGSRQAHDGAALGADVSGVNVQLNSVRTGTRTP